MGCGGTQQDLNEQDEDCPRIREKDDMTQTGKMQVVTTDRLWTIHDVSAFLGVPVGTLYQWRYLQGGPPAYRVGRHIRYDPAAVRAWLDTQAG